MERTNFIKERGQSLVILALILVGLIAMLGLALDGGNFLSKRRAAQNAADAGALAGADILCGAAGDPDSISDVIYTANYMATINNEADSANVSYSLDPENLSVTVNTYIPHDTYFAHFLSSSFAEVTADASATAGCYGACSGEGVLPVAWSCRPPIMGMPTPVPGAELECTNDKITWDQLDEYHYEGSPDDNEDCDPICPELYIVMDSESYSSDLYCKEEVGEDIGELWCDLDGDGEGDWIGSGGRSWLDLDGTEDEYDCDETPSEGADELREWIENGLACTIPKHVWIPEQRQVGPNFHTTEDRRLEDPMVIVPVFDDFCGDGDPRDYCPGKVHVDVDEYRPVPAQQPMYFHVFDFAAFYITCVRANPSDSCPGIETAMQLNPGILGNDVKSIEGYFIGDYIPGLGGRCEGMGTGAYTLYLNR